LVKAEKTPISLEFSNEQRVAMIDVRVDVEQTESGDYVCFALSVVQ